MMRIAWWVLAGGWWLAAAALGQTTLYVSPQGRLEWSGRSPAPNAAGTDGPLPSLAAARDTIRSLRQSWGLKEALTVLVRGGTYWLSEPFVLTPEDSGTAGRPVLYAAYPGERPILSGGRRIAGWRKGPGTAWIADAPWHFRQLFVSGRRAQRARTPNFGCFRIDGPSSQDKPFRLTYRGNDIRKSWEGGEVEVIALLAWAEIRMPILSVDEQARVAVLSGDPRPSNREADARYFIENAPDALDTAGEWRLDRAANLVSYRPLGGEDLAKEEVIAPALTQLIRLEGNPAQGQFVRHVTFRGLDFRHTDWSMGPKGYADTQAAIAAGAAFEGIGVEDCAIEKCTFAHHGGYAVWLSHAAKRNRIVGNEIFDMGAGGVKIGETVQRPKEPEQSFENVITDNHIHDLGLVYPAAVGVWVGQSSRTTISHNHIHDLYYTAISVGWTWGYGPNQSKGNSIEYNHLHHVGKEMMSDMGGIYTLGVQPGTVLRGNHIHDVAAFAYGGWGIYPDEGSSEMLIEGNVVYRCKSAGFHQHYGRDNTVRNNVFAFNREYQLMRTRAEPHRSFTFERNIVYFDSGRLLGSNWTGEGFALDRNVYWDARGGPLWFAGRSLAEWQQSGQDQESLVADPLFVDPGSFDFALRPESPALKLGFQPIDLRTVGPRVKPGA
jgi:parallel beta-helix repeat protein